MDKILLVDGYSILNRAFYGLPDLTNTKGEHTNGVLGFINIMFKIMEEEKPTHLAVAFDVHEKTFRHKMYEAYKGTRKGMPEELKSQVPLIKNLLQAMQIPVVECPGYEADDIIGTLSKRAEESGMEVSVLSGDRDLLQLATEHVLIKIPKTKGGHTTVENYHTQEVIELYGVTPLEFIDMKGLMGDSSDNIPGVPGIGEKTASKIISSYHSIEAAYEHLDEIKPKKAMENLSEFYDQALMSKKLATIQLDVPVSIDFSEMVIGEIFTQDAYAYVKQLELKSLLKHFELNEETANVDFKLNIMMDLAEVEVYFENLKKYKVLGVFPLFEGKEFLGLGVTKEDGIADFLVCSMFITESLIVERFIKLYNENEKLKIITGDLKKLLKVLPLTDEGRVQDAGVAAYLINPITDSYEYDDIARDYLNLTVPSKKELINKKEINTFVLEEKEISSYISYETCIPFIAWHFLSKRMEDMGLYQLYTDIEMPIVYVLEHMEREGIRVDAAALAVYGEMLGERIKSLETAIYEEAGIEFNINSPKQLGEVLFERLKLPGAKKTKTGYSTNVDVLNKLKNDYQIVRDVLDYRQVAKLKSTYADGLSTFISEDGRIHGTFNQTITATGRISSTEPNLQNIPMRTDLGRSIRKVFIPKDGCVFVDADYSQIELRVLAHFSKDEKLIDAYKGDADIHALTASQVFGVPIDKVDDLQRRNAKAVNFGIVYGISAFGLSEDLNISKKEAEDYIESYFKTYPGVKSFLDSTVAEAKESGMIKTMFGRIRQIPELTSSNFMQRSFGERVAMNSPIQGTAADIIKIAMIRVHKRLLKEHCKSSLILQIHDELLIETEKGEEELVRQILKEEMIHAADLAVPLLVSVSSGKTWYEAK